MALEDPTSKEFAAAVKAEDANWNHHLQQIPTPRLGAWKKAFHDYQAAAHPIRRDLAEVRFRWCGHAVAQQRGAAGYTTHLWVGNWHLDRAWSAVGFRADGWFYTLEDVGSGAEHLELAVWHWGPRAAEPRRVWSRAPVGPTVEIVGDRIYFSTVENLLRYPDVWVAPVATGQKAKCLFTEPDKRFQVAIMHRGGSLFIHKANALDQMLGVIEGESVHWITPEPLHSILIPIGAGFYARNDALVNWITGQVIPLPTGEWISDASLIAGTGAGTGTEGGMLVVTVSRGHDTVWRYVNEEWICLIEEPQPIPPAFHIIHAPTKFPTILFRIPSIPDSVWELRKGGLQKLFEYPEPLRLSYFGIGSTFDTVPAFWVSAVKRPKALLVEAYGAYGISARRAYPERWLPYLEAGWAIGTVCPRGGREGGDAWWDGGRTAVRKHHTFADTAVGIRALQRATGVGPAATVFFGRSAGGWLAANIAQEHGDLVAAVYAEVPYVDVLRTTLNPRLPLTQLEYDEFGDPARRPAEFRALQRISPVDTVPTCKKGECPLLVIRTALNDKQVLPYEALKWAARLRAAGWSDRVRVGIDHDGGHFAAAKSMADQRAEDAAFLESALRV